jgi:tRNA(Ile)-lysidine synthase
MDKQNSLINRLIKYNFFSNEEEFLLAVSGGVDSVVLFHIFTKLHLRFIVCHCNFHLRAGDCDEDENFVRRLCEENKIPFFVKHFDTEKVAKERKISIELAARELRYEWFKEVCYKQNINTLVVAHHANDNLETALYHLVKGTGISGLRGMQNIMEWGEKKIIRPLLFATKDEIIDYARENNLRWREDYTNADNKFARNLIRNDIIPKLKTINPNLEKNFNDTAERIVHVELFFFEELKKIRQRYCHEDGGLFFIEVDELKKKRWFHTVVWELLKDYGFSYKEIGILLEDSAEVRVIKNKDYELYYLGERWVISKKENLDERREIQEAEMKVEWQDMVLMRRDFQKYEIIKDGNIAAIDGENLIFPLTWRFWREGDVFCPIGKFRFRKNVSDFLNDMKIILPKKKKVRVLENGDGKIIWVVGLRLDDRFKITEKTKKIIEYKIYSNNRPTKNNISL